MEEIDWKKVRVNYPLLDNCTYFNTASSGAISKGTAEVMKNFANDQLNNATLNRSSWIKSIEEARSNTAELINAKSSEVAFTPDVSIAMSFTAQAFIAKKKVALLKDEFPSVCLPWISHDYEINWIERATDHSFDLADFELALKSGVEIVVVSWVHYNSGITTDLEQLGKLCKAHGAVFIVDGTQGLGAIPMDVEKWNVDILMGSTFKWLTGGYGTCIVYVAEKLDHELKQKAMGWNSLADFGGDPENKDNWKTGASSFELGHLKYSNVIAFSNALKELQDIGTGEINGRIIELRSNLFERLGEHGFETMAPNNTNGSVSGIIIAKMPFQLQKLLSAQQIISTSREDYIRLSVHFYNDFEDVDRLVETVSGYSHSNRG